MAWQTPKTDWSAHYDATGAFTGDYVNVVDYNRIKNNLMYLIDLAYPILYVPNVEVSADKTVTDFYYADEFNQIENGLQDLVDETNVYTYGQRQTFTDNGVFISYDELNRIESAELDLHGKITDSVHGAKRLSFRLGTSGRDIKI